MFRLIGLCAGCAGWLVLLVGASCWAAEELPVVFEDDFENGIERWTTTDPAGQKSVWLITEATRDDKPSHVLRVTGPSKYEPPFRSPLSIAWIKDLVVGDFVLTAKVQNTNVGAGGHRDLCFFWGRQDESHFYYVHLGAAPDPNSSQIFVVDDAPRTPITAGKSPGIPWSEGWHDVKIVRKLSSGAIEVFFDDMEKPVLTASDKRFGAGLVGVGTFDDNGNFDDLVLRGVQAEAGPAKLDVSPADSQ